MIAERLNKCIYETDIIARIDGDELISMAHKLKLCVVEEGVETENQLEFLKNYSCDMAQGYLFSNPIDENIFTKLLDINSNC